MMDKTEMLWPGWGTERLIGRGSFGIVYEIRRNISGREERAAVKHISIPQNDSDIEELYNSGYDEESITEYFEAHRDNVIAEYNLMKSLSVSPNIVKCDGIRWEKQDNGVGWDIYIKMELLMPLHKALTDSVKEETVEKAARDICSALVLCKEHNVVHRDIKSQNIFVSPNGNYKLGDFGIAKVAERTMGGTKIGTYNYMAPEVYNNEPYGVAADIYSLGLVLYWMLNDKRMPFLPPASEKIKAGMEDEARSRRLSGEPLPEPAHGSEKMKAIVMKACAYSPEERYHSAKEMLGALEQMDQNPSLDIKPKTVLIRIIEATSACQISGKGLLNLEIGSKEHIVSSGEVFEVKPEDKLKLSIFSSYKESYSIGNVDVLGRSGEEYSSKLKPISSSQSYELFMENDDIIITVYLKEKKKELSFDSRKLFPIAVGAIVLLAIILLVGGKKPTVQPPPPTPESVALSIPSSTPEPTPVPTPPLIASEYTGSRGALRKLYVTKVDASSILVDPVYGVFPADAVLDGLLYTSWQEGVSGYGAGESITLYFEGEEELSVIDIYPGLQQSDYTFEVNGRPKDVILSFSDGRSCQMRISDTMGCHTIMLSEPVTTSYIQIEIDDVYTAYTRCEDTAISEIIPYST